MVVKLNKVERVAGLFVILAFLAGVFSILKLAQQKGWFESKVSYSTKVLSAEGIHPGTEVKFSGLRIGKVTSVELLESNEVQVKLSIYKKFKDKVKEDAELLLVRPFVIGDKVFELLPGREESKVLQAGSDIKLQSSLDIMDILSGRRLSPFISDLNGLLANMKVIAEAFGDSSRSKSFIRIFDQLEPLVNNLNKMSVNVTSTTKTLNDKKRLEQLVVHLNQLSVEFNKLTPTIQAMAPKLPKASLRAIEALDETVITLKALQKTFILKGSVEEVRKSEKLRLPASE